MFRIPTALQHLCTSMSDMYTQMCLSFNWKQRNDNKKINICKYSTLRYLEICSWFMIFVEQFNSIELVTQHITNDRGRNSTEWISNQLQPASSSTVYRQKDDIGQEHAEHHSKHHIQMQLIMILLFTSTTRTWINWIRWFCFRNLML